MVATGLPTPAHFYVRSEHPPPEIQPPYSEIVADQRGNSFRGLTVAPGILPDPLDHGTFLDTLRTYPQRAFNLGWITDTAVATELETTLNDARTHLAAADSSAARTTLNDVLALVEAEQTRSLSSEAYALLRYNTEYLRDRLPEAPTLPDLPGAITLAAADASASFSGGSFTLSGFDHAADGSLTASGLDAHGLFTTSAAAQQTLLAALSNNQQTSITGTGPAPDIVEGTLDFDPAALITDLLDHVTDTLSVTHTGTLGSPEDPSSY